MRPWARATLVGYSDGLGLVPKDDPETCHCNFDPPQRGWLPRFGTPRRHNLDGNLEDIGPTMDFTCTRRQKLNAGFLPGEPRTRALRSGAEYSTDWATAALF